VNGRNGRVISLLLLRRCWNLSIFNRLDFDLQTLNWFFCCKRDRVNN